MTAAEERLDAYSKRMAHTILKLERRSHLKFFAIALRCEACRTPLHTVSLDLHSDNPVFNCQDSRHNASSLLPRPLRIVLCFLLPGRGFGRAMLTIGAMRPNQFPLPQFNMSLYVWICRRGRRMQQQESDENEEIRQPSKAPDLAQSQQIHQKMAKEKNASRSTMMMVVKNDLCFTSYRLQKQQLLIAATKSKRLARILQTLERLNNEVEVGGECQTNDECMEKAECKNRLQKYCRCKS
ncbi:unnamed protein product [Darwinula stevensoni]|uniref:Uncharacterized protein n=1 Tax=Darwinula stevensoni TaxID=69355 RepID=A0A7R9ACZ4_9CRUS|nr:unnamed protein product [Darwinula stevensoni]CAG0900817.1 unnamed protein product [Darwinula stevensoni]